MSNTACYAFCHNLKYRQSQKRPLKDCLSTFQQLLAVHMAIAYVSIINPSNYI